MSFLNTEHLLCVPSCQGVQEFLGNHGHPVEERAKMKLLTEVDTNMLVLKKKRIVWCLTCDPGVPLSPGFPGLPLLPLERNIKEEVKTQLIHGQVIVSVLAHDITALTSSPFLPGGPGGPRGPIAPCYEKKKSTFKFKANFQTVRNCLDQEYLQPVRALQAHQHVLGILEVPIYSWEKE